MDVHVSPQQTFIFDRANPATMAQIFGDADTDASPEVSVSWTEHRCPIVAPTKRRGLTGKAYRAARRRYRRDLRRWRRAGAHMIERHYFMPRVRIDPDTVLNLARFDVTACLSPAPEPQRLPDGWYDVGYSVEDQS